MHSFLIRRLPRACATGFIALMAIWSAPSFAENAPAAAALAGKFLGNADLTRLQADAGARLPVIVEFAMPSVAAAAIFASPDLADKAHIGAVHAAQDDILEGLFGGSAAKAEASADNVIKRMDYSPMFAMNATAADLEKLAADSRVVRIHEDVRDRPQLNQTLPLIGMPAAYTAGATGNGYRVAILDTGARRSHEFLSSRVTAAACFTSNNASLGQTATCPGGTTQSTAIDSADDCDPANTEFCGHGTYISGIAAGFNTNLQSGEPVNGVARDARILSINIYSNFSVAGGDCGELSPQYTNGCRQAPMSDQIRGLEYVYSLRNSTPLIAAVNMSNGGSPLFSTDCNADARKSIIDQLRAANIVTVVAVGNDNTDATIRAPACIPSALAVTGSTEGDERAFGSNWGALVDLVAPGQDVTAPFPSGSSNTSYADVGGTSAAAAHVTGAWAALRAARPNATMDEIETALKSTGLGITVAGVTKPRIRVSNALSAIDNRPANDNFADRIAIAPSPSGTSTTTGSNVYATAETGEPNHDDQTTNRNSVWWSFTPSVTGPIAIDTLGSNFDTILSVYTGNAVIALTYIVSNDQITSGVDQSWVNFNGTAGVQYNIAVTGVDNDAGNINLRVQNGIPLNVNILSAVLPAARSAQVNQTITALATVINTGNGLADDCSIALPSADPTIEFSYRLVSPSGMPGPLNAPTDIAGFSSAQNFLMTFKASTPQANNIPLVFDCANSNPAPSTNGLNRFLLTATIAAPADVISTMATPSGDGIMNVPLGGTGVAAAAAINIGSAANLQARASAYPSIGPIRSSILPGTPLICQTDPSTGQCLTPLIAPTVDFSLAANQIATFTAFFWSNGTAIPFDPANKRVFINFFQGMTVVGSTSVAVRTTAPAAEKTVSNH